MHAGDMTDQLWRESLTCTSLILPTRLQIYNGACLFPSKRPVELNSHVGMIQYTRTHMQVRVCGGKLCKKDFRPSHNLTFRVFFEKKT